MLRTRLKDMSITSRKCFVPKPVEYVLFKTFSCVVNKMCLRPPQDVFKSRLEGIYKRSWSLLGVKNT